MDDRTIVKKRTGMRSTFIVLIIIFGVLIGGIFYAYNWYDSAVNNPPSDSTETVDFEVTEGDTFGGLLDELEAQGVINNAQATRIYLQLNDVNPEIKVGNYDLPQNKPLEDIIATLEQGVFKSSVTVTIKEGTQTEDIAQIIETQFALSGAEVPFDQDEFLDIALNPDNYVFREDIQTFLDEHKPNGKPLRGFLYPDTYFLAVDMNSQMVVEFILENFINRYNEAITAESYQTQNITNLYDALILASIIEKEAALGDDRAEISGVFHNRLNNFITLDADSTINFVTGQTSEVLDTSIDSPYNSYRNLGLVPTPINNPRIDSIVAAIVPNETPYFYFFHDVAGNTYYSVTLSEHTTKVCDIRGCF